MNDQTKSSPNAFPESEPPTNPAAFEIPQHPSIDSLLLEAIKTVSAAAADIRLEREERRQFAKSQQDLQEQILAQQRKVLEAIEKADSNNTANYQIMRNEMSVLQRSDANQNSKIAQLERQHAERIAEFEKTLATLKSDILQTIQAEILETLPNVMQSALMPYVSRIEDLEKLLADEKKR